MRLRVVIITLVLCIPTGAAAHDGLIRSVPPNGARLAVAPTQAILEFGAPFGQIIAVRVQDRAGTNRARAARRDPRNARRIIVALRPGPRGRYVITWRIRAADGHAQRGIVRFAVR